MAIDDLIKKEMTPKTVTHWGQKHYNHVPVLIDNIHGDGQCFVYIVPLATRPDYYIIRVDSSVKQMIENDDDEIRDLLESELYAMIETEYGNYDDHEDYDGKDIMLPFPALNYSCGCGWGVIEETT